jgi:hypothetical protein
MREKSFAAAAKLPVLGRRRLKRLAEVETPNRVLGGRPAAQTANQFNEPGHDEERQSD